MVLVVVITPNSGSTCTKKVCALVGLHVNGRTFTMQLFNYLISIGNPVYFVHNKNSNIILP
jgi:hypothetical protein